MIRRLRLASGLVMFAYVTTHFVNHSLGLVSVQVMDRALEHIYHYWASLLGSVLLYGAFATHYSLALWALWLRRSLKMPFAEATQLILGFSIPFFLTDHVLQTRVADTFYGADVGYYANVLHTYFVDNPLRGFLQLVVLVVAWVHAMIGLWFWLRLKPWYRRWQPILYAFALLLPTLAILGFFEGGRQVMALSEDPAWVAQQAQDHPPAAPADAAVVDQMVVWVRYAFVAPLLPATAQASDGFSRPGYLHGAERDIAILFGDLRSFTQLSEKKLPYDLVFLLNRYFAETGHAVEAAGGRIDKFIGDGVMALFGLDSGVEAGCREALAAAKDMAERMESLNRALIHDIPEPLRIGIGIHTGPAIVGEMGYGTAVSVTTVCHYGNNAHRIQTLTQTHPYELL